MGKIDIELEITINATMVDVWAVFSDFKAYSDWSPTLHFIASAPEVGKKVAVLLHQPDGKKMTMHPKVLRLSAGKELRWLGRVFLPGIFDGEHYFILKPNADGTTQFIQGENFNGILVPFLKKMILGPTREGFEAFNIALKKRVEDRKNTGL
ncbi:SRPBCC domain-containing protein [Sphingobacterium deserti]|nr:SRPBCC domain-containing protein [Sphingobacterium deserti]